MLHRHLILATLVAVAAGATLFAARGASGAEPDRGRALYESRCTACHAESVHARKKRVAADFDGVRRWVDRWNGTLRLGWGAAEIDDVTVYLNNTYYRFPCPPTICKVVS